MGTEALLRFNEQQPQVVFLPHLKFTNEFLMVSLAKRPETNLVGAMINPYIQQLPLSGIWRIYVQFDTSRQQLLVRIPMYDSAVQKMVNSCE